MRISSVQAILFSLSTGLLLLGTGCGPDSPCADGEGRCVSPDGGQGDDGGGLDGGSASCGPDPTLHAGDPISAPDSTWTWVDFPATRCMDGSSTGIGVNLNPASDKLVIYLQGGGACFDTFTCRVVANPGGFSQADFQNYIAAAKSRGIFDRDNPNNPLRDWNQVFVPYCSGDVHAGAAFQGYGGRIQIGAGNYRAYLERLVPTFKDASQVLLSGSSAGGFGAALNFPQTQDAFGCVTVDLLDDAGPPMSDTYLKACLQKQWREAWKLDDSLPAECTNCSLPDGGGIVNFMPYIASHYPKSKLGLLSTTADNTIRTFFSYGYSQNCDLVSNMPAADFEAGLLELRDDILVGHGNAKTFYAPGSFHTFLGADPNSIQVGGTTLSLWIDRLVTHDPAWTHVGP